MSHTPNQVEAKELVKDPSFDLGDKSSIYRYVPSIQASDFQDLSLLEIIPPPQWSQWPTQPVPFWISQVPSNAATANPRPVGRSPLNCSPHHGLALLDAFWSDQKRQESIFLLRFVSWSYANRVICEMFVGSPQLFVKKHICPSQFSRGLKLFGSSSSYQLLVRPRRCFGSEVANWGIFALKKIPMVHPGLVLIIYVTLWHIMTLCYLTISRYWFQIFWFVYAYLSKGSGTLPTIFHGVKKEKQPRYESIRLYEEASPYGVVWKNINLSKKGYNDSNESHQHFFLGLRIMGFQNWLFGDPRTLLYRVKLLYRRVQCFLGSDSDVFLGVYVGCGPLNSGKYRFIEFPIRILLVTGILGGRGAHPIHLMYNVPAIPMFFFLQIFRDLSCFTGHRHWQWDGAWEKYRQHEHRCAQKKAGKSCWKWNKQD